MAELCAWSKLWYVEATERDGYRCARDLATGKLGLSIERGRRQSAYSLSTLHCFHTPRPLHIRSWLFWSRFVLEVSPISPQSVFKSRYDRLQVIHGVTVKGCQCELWKENATLRRAGHPPHHVMFRLSRCDIKDLSIKTFVQYICILHDYTVLDC